VEGRLRLLPIEGSIFVRVGFLTSVTGSLLVGFIFSAHCQTSGPSSFHPSTLIPRGNEKPSFDCARAKTASARLICADGELAKLDGKLGLIYARQKTQLAITEQSDFIQRQLDWIRERNAACGLIGKDTLPVSLIADAKACMLTQIEGRIASLAGGGSETVLSAGGDQFGAVRLRYENSAGPVRTTGSYPDVRLLLNEQIILRDTSAAGIYIVAAFPSWHDPAIAVLNISAGGNACGGSYAILDVKTAAVSESFGNCGQPAIRETTDGLVFAFPDEPVEAGWIYRNGQVTKVPILRAEEHVQKGIAAYLAKNYATALEHLWLVRESRFADAFYYLGLMANFGYGVRSDYALAMSL
jgi:uncharacterized protein YecT (DUF1311 family)